MVQVGRQASGALGLFIQQCRQSMYRQFASCLFEFTYIPCFTFLASAKRNLRHRLEESKVKGHHAYTSRQAHSPRLEANHGQPASNVAVPHGAEVRLDAQLQYIMRYGSERQQQYIRHQCTTG